jgi:DNA-binding MarR family transcriptional regulator
MRFKNLKLFLPISIIGTVGIIGIIGYTISQHFIHTLYGAEGLCPRMVPNYVLWISIILMIIVISPLSYFIISKKLEEKMEKSLRTITKLVDTKLTDNIKKDDFNLNNLSNNNFNNSVIFKLLSSNEKKVIQKLIEKNGEMFQSEITQIQGMTKLKAHRAVKEMQKKGILNIEHHGKTNKLIIVDDFKDVILR